VGWEQTYRAAAARGAFAVPGTSPDRCCIRLPKCYSCCSSWESLFCFWFVTHSFPSFVGPVAEATWTSWRYRFFVCAIWRRRRDPDRTVSANCGPPRLPSSTIFCPKRQRTRTSSRNRRLYPPPPTIVAVEKNPSIVLPRVLFLPTKPKTSIPPGLLSPEFLVLPAVVASSFSLVRPDTNR